jgi:hypothetical protein
MSNILPLLGDLPFMGNICPQGHFAGFQARLHLPSGDMESRISARKPGKRLEQAGPYLSARASGPPFRA